MARKFTTEKSIKMVSDKISDDISYMMNRKEMAVSSFRRTANDLAVINNTLGEKKAALSELRSFIESQEAQATQMIADNESVRAKILDIIGE
jgi:hypothetical protein